MKGPELWRNQGALLSEGREGGHVVRPQRDPTVLQKRKEVKKGQKYRFQIQPVDGPKLPERIPSPSHLVGKKKKPPQTSREALVNKTLDGRPFKKGTRAKGKSGK